MSKIKNIELNPKPLTKIVEEWTEKQSPSFDELSASVLQTHQTAQTTAIRAVNQMATLRNWLIGCYIVEYEQKGKDNQVHVGRGDQRGKREAEHDTNDRQRPYLQQLVAVKILSHHKGGGQADGKIHQRMPQLGKEDQQHDCRNADRRCEQTRFE